MKFKDWIDRYDCFDTFVGINKISHAEAARLAWDKQQEEIESLERRDKRNAEFLEVGETMIRKKCGELNTAITALWLLDEHKEAQEALKDLGLWGVGTTKEIGEIG